MNRGIPATPPGSSVPETGPPAPGGPGEINRLAVTEVFRLLGSDRGGLSEAEARERLQRYGPNALREVTGRPLPLRLLANFTHLMALLLWAGGAIAFASRLPELGAAIWAVNVVNGAFSFWQEYKAEKAAEALRRVLPLSARVVRDGGERRIPAGELVPGDVLVLGEGDRISADARLIAESELRADQSTLSGEAHPVRKTADPVPGRGLSPAELSNLVFAGTSVAAGGGRAIVYATGMATQLGTIAHLTQTMGEKKSPLQREMERATRIVTGVAVGAGLLFFGVAILVTGMGPAEGFFFALGMIVAFVPEGLLPTVTLSLAMGAQRMARRRALIKRLSAVETLGCTSVIGTDKTGTLTENEMTVTRIWIPGRMLVVSGAGYAPEGEIRDSGEEGPLSGSPAEGLRDLLATAIHCCNARLLPPGGGETRWSVLGDPTEGALLVAGAKGGLDAAALSRETPRLREIPFDSRRRRMTTVHRAGEGRVAFVKGAPGELIGLCSRMTRDGREEPLTAAGRGEIEAAVDGLAREGLRVLAVARRALPEGIDAADPGAVEQDLAFLGLAGMTDPPRPEVAEAVARCRRAGIRIVMITGDYGLTAESVARRVGIVAARPVRILNGADIDALDDEAFRKALREEVILARATPEHKLRAVTALQAMGHVVAVTGDGVNDAPALKRADIGIAMGIAGTDVAREAADMILTDDHFATIVNAVEEGRAVFDNIRKFVTYIFTSNTPEAVPFVVHALSGGSVPLALNIMQILSIDLGTDIVPALALGAEPPEPGVMDRPPRKLTEHAITLPLLLRAYPFLGLLQAAAAMAAFYYAFWTAGHWGRFTGLPAEGALYLQATAMTLAAVVCTQVGNLFAQRTERMSVFRHAFFANRFVWAGIASEAVLLLLIIYVPGLQRVFGTAAIPPGHWLFLLALVPVLLIADEARKAWRRRGRGRVAPPLSRRATRGLPCLHGPTGRVPHDGARKSDGEGSRQGGEP